MGKRRVWTLPYFPKTRCESDIGDENKKWRLREAEFKKKPVDFRCTHTAVFSVDSRKLCKRHAEAMALTMLLANGGKDGN